jgi:hypothetical protein
MILVHYWHLRAIRKQLWPNDAFVKLIDQHFNLDGKLIRTIQEHKIVFDDENPRKNS